MQSALPLALLQLRLPEKTKARQAPGAAGCVAEICADFGRVGLAKEVEDLRYTLFRDLVLKNTRAPFKMKVNSLIQKVNGLIGDHRAFEEPEGYELIRKMAVCGLGFRLGAGVVSRFEL